MNSTIIGIGCCSNAGKDTLADFIVDILSKFPIRRKISKKSFAFLGKDLCFQIFGIYGLKTRQHYDLTETRAERDQIIPLLGKTPVQIWVTVGNTIRQIYPYYWIDALFKEAESLLYKESGVEKYLIIPDVRFLNEAQAIRNRQGFLIKVESDRAIVKSESDQDIPSDFCWDEIVRNYSTKDALRKEAERICEVIKTKARQYKCFVEENRSQAT